MVLGRALDSARGRYEWLLLAVLLGSIFLFPRAVPLGIYGSGVVAGSALALQAVGLVLVFRSNRIINFAQVQIGVFAATLFTGLVQSDFFLRVVQAGCPSCVSDDSVGFYRATYLLALLLSLALGVGLAWLIQVVVVRRLAASSPLVLTVATIFLAQLLAGLRGVIPNLLFSREQREAATGGGGSLQLSPASLPWDVSFTLNPVRFNLADVLTVLVAAGALVGVILYLRRSSTGVAIRAAAENPTRAGTLGMNAGSVVGRVWVLAGLLSTVAALLAAMSTAPEVAPFSGSFTVRMLAVAVIARLVSLPVAGIAGLTVGVVDRAVGWSFDSTALLDGALLVVIGVALLIQRTGSARADADASIAWQATREIRPIPAQLRGLPVVRKWLRGAALAGIVLLASLPWVLQPSQTSLATNALIFGIVGLSLLVLTGWSGQISLGQFAFAAVGAYVTAVVGLPFPIPVVLGAVAGGVVAVAVGIPAIRLRGLYLAIITLSFSLATAAILLNPRYLGKSLPTTLERPALLGLDLEDGRTFYYFTLAVLALTFVGVLGLRRSRFARALIGTRDNERAAQALGISLVRARLGAFVVSGAIAALAGGIYAYAQFGVKPPAYSPETSITVFLMSVIGGFGAVSGPLIGALYLGALTLFSTTPGVTFIGTGGGGLLVLLLAPGGIGQVVFNIRDALLRRVAERHRIIVPSLVADIGVTSNDRVDVLPKQRPGGGVAFVPSRYRLGGQWALTADDDASDGTGTSLRYANLDEVATVSTSERESAGRGRAGD